MQQERIISEITIGKIKIKLKNGRASWEETPLKELKVISEDEPGDKVIEGLVNDVTID